MTALHHACANGHDEVVTHLLSHGRLLVNKADNNGGTALHWAASGRHATILKQLLAFPSVDSSAVDKVCPFS